MNEAAAALKTFTIKFFEGTAVRYSFVVTAPYAVGAASYAKSAAFERTTIGEKLRSLRWDADEHVNALGSRVLVHAWSGGGPLEPLDYDPETA